MSAGARVILSSMVSSRAPVLAALVLALVAGAPAAAGPFLQGSVSLNGGWTDNGSGAPSGTGGAATDVYGEIRPSLLLLTGTPRTVVRLGYSLTGALHLQSELDSYTNRIDAAAALAPAKTTTLFLFLSATEGPLLTQLTQADPSGGQVMVLPSGNNVLLSTGAGASLHWEITPRWRLSTALAFSLVAPLTSPREPLNLVADGGVGFDHLWARDSLGAQARVAFADYGATHTPVTLMNPSGIASPEQRAMTSSLTVRWRHDFGHFFTSNLAAGASGSFHADGSGQQWGATGSAALHYVHPIAQAALSYSHGVEPNAFTGQTYNVDTVSLRAGLPLGRRTQLMLSASTGYQHASVTGATGGNSGDVDVVMADVGLTWWPRPELSVGARYQLSDQFGSSNTMTVPTSATGSPSFLRNLVMVSLTVRYPSTPYPLAFPRIGVRVDGTDQAASTPAHAEPPPPAEPAPESSAATGSPAPAAPPSSGDGSG